MSEPTRPIVVHLCAGCALPLYGQGLPIVTVRGYRYHTSCWVFERAPSLHAIVCQN